MLLHLEKSLFIFQHLVSIKVRLRYFTHLNTQQSWPSKSLWWWEMNGLGAQEPLRTASQSGQPISQWASTFNFEWQSFNAYCHLLLMHDIWQSHHNLHYPINVFDLIHYSLLRIVPKILSSRVFVVYNKKRRLIYTLRHPFPGFSIAKIALFNRSSKETFPLVTKLICKMLHLTAYEVNCLPLTCQMRLTCQGGREGRRVLESGRERSVDGEWCNDGLIHCLYFVLNNFVPFFI